jgi:hypothetical protein
VNLHRPDPESGTRHAIGAPFDGPPETFDYASAEIAVPANRTKDRVEAGISFDAPGSLSERADDFRARNTVIGQKIDPGMPQHHEQFRFHA